MFNCLGPLTVAATISTLLVSYTVYQQSHESTSWRTVLAASDLQQFRALEAQSVDIGRYSLEGDDYPNFSPFASPGPIRLTMEESVHYTIDSDPNITTEEWLYNSPYGSGTYRVGAYNRTFYISMFHYMHCIRRMHAAFMSVPGEGEWHHLQHCFDTLRQAILCQADMTLEEGDFTKLDFKTERFGAQHVCRDWEAVYDEVERNWFKWRRYVKSNNLPEWQE
ncbi:hypothetical protein Moror_13669 [Moniliophthora roreri MCA 2997]|uniref:Tat pathway signal sequence n=2 Tax=Moniliophthora roreri TaxID=221103 RepID=V2XC64_MONRO|nr:hypothetical protein Moror_13669 [Moniliophthora roreri MCA 2997]KAI3600739.1 hypothetical protein WG66_014175 [Moniliophthora roreri]